jgi:phosphohistidine phosphatase
MAKKLFIIRHAKSSWKDLTLDDFDRPLNNRGKNDAPKMGKRLKNRNILPDLIISSSAKRTISTAKIIAKKVKYKKDIFFTKELYESSVKAMYNILIEISDDNNTVFLVGHNTGINGFVHDYIDLNENVPTCGVVEIEFNCEKWCEISIDNAKLISFDYPKRKIATS